MMAWHDGWLADAALRIGGLVLLGLVVPGGRWDGALVRAGDVLAYPVSALLFVGASAGVALLLWGGRRWAPVTLSARWESRGD